jgi:elongation of very long chain fatty acids protein 4
MALPTSLEGLASLVRSQGHHLIKFSAGGALDSDAAFARRALAGAPLIELDEAMLCVAAYAALVLYGVAVRPAGGDARPAPALQPAAAAPAAGAAPKRRKAFSLGGTLAKFAKEPVVLPLMLLYNVAQVALCGYMMAEAVRVALAHYSAPVCNAHDNSARSALKDVLWLFYVSKVLDFADTLFIVLRGKWEQFSFLHIYHHFSIFLTYWLVANAAPDGDVYYTIVANSLVHLVMYFYYLMMTIDFPPPFPWVWVTYLQMTQFVTMMSQAIYILAFGCPYPGRVTAYYLGYIASLFLLFAQFMASKQRKEAKSVAAKKA